MDKKQATPGGDDTEADLLELLEEAERAGVEIEVDAIIKMPPKESFPINLQITEINKATPNIITPDDTD